MSVFEVGTTGGTNVLKIGAAITVLAVEVVVAVALLLVVLG